MLLTCTRDKHCTWHSPFYTSLISIYLSLHIIHSIHLWYSLYISIPWHSSGQHERCWLSICSFWETAFKSNTAQVMVCLKIKPRLLWACVRNLAAWGKGKNKFYFAAITICLHATAPIMGKALLQFMRKQNSCPQNLHMKQNLISQNN